MRLHCGQKCSSTGAPAPQLRHSSIDEDLRALRPLEHLVAEARLALPGEGVAETRAAAALHAHTKAAFADALLGHQRPDFLRGSLGYLNHCLQVRLKADST